MTTTQISFTSLAENLESSELRLAKAQSDLEATRDRIAMRLLSWHFEGSTERHVAKSARTVAAAELCFRSLAI